ncbi:hypothetical protein H0E87_013551 [Populus deltoides]|uniref:Uncharacterized protein n=1 Tax=Populus deltoides TaxID=3696 RepID=A0A8T2YNV8_POPDE|nr:hypothetical protein H0E87_013551 [Populus deltoides]
MAEKNNIEKTSKSHDSSQDPPLLATSSSQKSKKEEPETIRESKRRKKCPTALDKIEELAPSNPSFSFTFDTQFGGNSQEPTPKFGSFNLVASTQERVDDTGHCFHQSLEDEEGGHQEEEVDGQQGGVGEEGVVNVSKMLRRSIDGIREIK